MIKIQRMHTTPFCPEHTEAKTCILRSVRTIFPLWSTDISLQTMIGSSESIRMQLLLDLGKSRPKMPWEAPHMMVQSLQVNFCTVTGANTNTFI
jgi:hypothetical protein